MEFWEGSVIAPFVAGKISTDVVSPVISVAVLVSGLFYKKILIAQAKIRDFLVGVEINLLLFGLIVSHIFISAMGIMVVIKSGDAGRCQNCLEKYALSIHADIAFLMIWLLLFFVSGWIYATMHNRERSCVRGQQNVQRTLSPFILNMLSFGGSSVSVAVLALYIISVVSGMSS